ncbi:imelysin family protein [Thiomicrorhabdus sp.]|uniref:imelysin family protein n=1 Tax=Thiomicrorhabdus sp. TaxID=2039724 RepID=UPI0029C7682A|nr:imelysin family protein [Thiomicrorhabdus sp.]
MKQQSLKWVGVAFVSTFLAACGGERTNDPIAVANEQILEAQTAITENQILPLVDDFKNDAQTFEQLSSEFCNTPVDEARLSALQDAWKQLILSWNALEIFNFGPLYDNILFPKSIVVNPFREKGVDYHGSVLGDLQAKLASSDEVTFQQREYYNYGLLALETLAFESLEASPSTDSAAIINEYNTSARKCSILQKYAEYMRSQADYIDYGWNTEYLSEGQAFKDIYMSGTWNDDSDSTEELFKAIQSHLDYMKRRQVLSRTSYLSDTGYPNALAAIESIEKVLEGAPGSGISLFEIMETAGFTQEVETVRQNIASAKTAIAAQDQVSFEAAAGLLDGNFKREIPDSLEVSVGLGSITDGD